MSVHCFPKFIILMKFYYPASVCSNVLTIILNSHYIETWIIERKSFYYPWLRPYVSLISGVLGLYQAWERSFDPKLQRAYIILKICNHENLPISSCSMRTDLWLELRNNNRGPRAGVYLLAGRYVQCIPVCICYMSNLILGKFWFHLGWFSISFVS